MKVKILQELLKDSGHYSGKVDGDYGQRTRAAIRSYYDFPTEWEDSRLKVGCIQVICIKNGFIPGSIDGRWGRNTQSAYDKLLKLLGKSEKKTKVNQSVKTKKGYSNWPKQDYSSMVRFYGKVGENQTLLTLPYSMVLAWDTNVNVGRMSCHSKVSSSLERIFQKTLEHYGLPAIKELNLDQFGGCLNVRKKRGGSSWSIHSWGAAVDLDPERNQLHWGKNKAYFAKKDYEPFWKIVAAEGWTSLGKERNFDWMHFQAAHL